MMDSQHLLADYRRTGSDAAFRELVTRYVDLVYSSALRRVEGDKHRAEDVSQTVFVDLARQARTLPADVRLGGWLHRHTCFVAANTLRGERRRQSRERQAAEMNALQNHSAADFSQVAPLLDEAINELGEADRTAILLRFFEQQDFRAVGQALGSNEDAARMRVTRALGKLEEFLKRRGVTTSAASLGVVLTANAVQAAPVGLAVTISTAAALAGTTLTTIATQTTMNWITAKTVSAIVAAAITAGTATYLVKQRESNRMRSENQNLAAANLALSNERDAALSTSTANNDELERLRKEKNELLRLRGEVGVLRKQVSEIANLKEENLRLRAAPSSVQNKQSPQAPTTAQTDFPKKSWAFAGYATPEAALQTWTWAMSKGDKQTMLASLAPDARKEWESLLANQSDSQIAAGGAENLSKISGYQIVDHQARSDSEVELTMSNVTIDGRSNKMKMTVQRIENEWKIAGPSKDQ